MKRIFAFLILLLPLVGTAFAQAPSNLTKGTWANEDNTAHLQFTQVGDRYFAELVWMAQPNDESGNPKKDKNNPDKNLRSRSLVGIYLIWDLKPEGKYWVDGTIYNPGKGLLAACELEMIDADSFRLKATKGLFSVTKVWKRLN